MANGFVFTSPGIKYRETDITQIQKQLGITTLGLVGETLKGPAFEPIFIESQQDFYNRFGGQSIERFKGNNQLQYQLPYVANAYLNESNQLYVTRILGLSGYQAGTGWAIVMEAGVDLTTTGTTGNPVTGTSSFSNNVYLGTSLYQVGDHGVYFSGFTKVSLTGFSGNKIAFTATTINNGSGTVKTKTYTLTGSSLTEYENMVLAVIRSRATVTDNINLPSTTTFVTTNLSISANTTVIGIGDLFGKFTLTASKPSGTTESYIVSLNPNDSNFISNVIGSEAKDKNSKIWVEAIYPDLIKKLDADGLGYGIRSTVVDLKSDAYTNYVEQYKTPETPWIVSQLQGNKISRLFKFISISDGNSANQEIKVELLNINPITQEFDIYVRDFNDTDDNLNILESFTNCSMIEGTNNFVAQRIGTTDGIYTLNSNYIMLEMADNIPEGSYPAGFEGYNFKDYSISGTSTTSGINAVKPKIFYKQSYSSNDRISRVCLGISNSAYNATSLIGTGINQNFFNYNGQSGFEKTKGFHLDINATGDYYEGIEHIGEFEVGVGGFSNISDIVSPSSTYYALNTRKFVLVPAGGFDGWDVNREQRTNGDLYTKGGIYDGVSVGVTPKNDFQAWETAINTFSNPEQVTINLFATPGINWSDQNLIVKDTIIMIEEQRADSLYVIDSPDITIEQTIGDDKPDIIAAQDITDLLDTADIDSNYSATYFPWIQIRDTQNNVNVYIPSTSEVVKSMAYTDNTSFPWFAPAGLNRGVTNARKSKYKLSLDARDILYENRINPIADFPDVGTAIFGQKTLQVKDSALNRINVRRLILQMKVLISNVAVRLLFEQDDQTTIDQFLSKVNPILSNIKRERGLQDFQVEMPLPTPEQIDRNELYGTIKIKPSRSLEFIGIEFVITPTGAEFNA